jgi:hypothetical protein
MVDATLDRGAYEVRAYEVRSEKDESPEYVESRKSPGTKKCWSSAVAGVLACEMAMGMGGTGGTSTVGDAVARLVTPGIYAIWMMFEARVRTVEAIEWVVWVEAR